MSKFKHTTIGGLIIAFFSWIGQACSPFGKPVDKDISASYFFSKSGNEVIYSPSGNWFELGKSKINGVDISSFKVLSEYLAKDNKQAYHKGESIPLPIDLPTLRVGEGDFMILTFMDKNNVYTTSRDDGVIIIKDADPASFTRIDYPWSKDAHLYFYNNEPISVDYASFEVLNESMAKDKFKAYRFGYNTGFKPFKADAANLKKLDNEYVYDKANFYYYAHYVKNELVDSLNTMPYTDLASVKVLNDTYIKIDTKIYQHGFLLEGVEASDFESLEHLYAKDNRHYYYWGSLIKESDAATFEIMDMQYSKDKNNVYYQDKIVVGANPTSFKRSKDAYYYEDGLNKYDEGEIIADEE